jgi:hypothetical protein
MQLIAIVRKLVDLKVRFFIFFIWTPLPVIMIVRFYLNTTTGNYDITVQVSRTVLLDAHHVGMGPHLKRGNLRAFNAQWDSMHPEANNLIMSNAVH